MARARVSMVCARVRMRASRSRGGRRAHRCLAARVGVAAVPLGAPACRGALRAALASSRAREEAAADAAAAAAAARFSAAEAR